MGGLHRFYTGAPWQAPYTASSASELVKIVSEGKSWKLAYEGEESDSPKM